MQPNRDKLSRFENDCSNEHDIFDKCFLTFRSSLTGCERTGLRHESIRQPRPRGIWKLKPCKQLKIIAINDFCLPAFSF